MCRKRLYPDQYILRNHPQTAIPLPPALSEMLDAQNIPVEQLPSFINYPVLD